MDTLGYTYYGDSVYHLSYTFPNVSNSIILNFSGIGLQGIGDESWGLDNVSVRVFVVSDGLSHGIIQFRNATYSINENGTPATQVALDRTNGSDGEVSVILTPSNGSAIAGDDYTNTPITVTFANGETSKTVTIPINNDTVYEPTETVNLTLSSPTGGATLGTQTTAVLNIIDNDAVPGVLAFSQANYSINEDGTPVVAVTVNRTGGSDGSVSATISLTDGTATRPDDYINTSVTVDFANGETSKVVTIPIVNDGVFEPNETINLTLNNPTNGATLGTQTTAVLTIINDNTPPVLTLSTNKKVIDEELGNNAAIGTVTRNVVTNQDLIVTLTSSNTTEATVPVQVVIPAGQASANFDINVIDDGIPDGDQKVTLTATAGGYDPVTYDVIVTDFKMPDLVITEFSNSETLYTGKQSFFTYKVVNNGLFTADATADPLVDHIYLSSDPNLDKNDKLLADVSINGTILTGQFYQRNLPFFAPTTPGNYYLIAEIDTTDVVNEGVFGETNNLVVTPITVQAAYRGVVATDVEVGIEEQSIVLRGEALSNEDNSPIPFEFVTIAIKNNGFVRELSALTDINGNFVKTFKPLPGEAGTYEINAYFPGVPTEDAAPEDSFKLLGMRFTDKSISQKILADQTFTGQVTLQNLSDIPINGITYIVEGAPSNWQIKVNTPSNLAGSGQNTLTYTILAPNNSTVTQDNFNIRLTSTEGVRAVLPVTINLERIVPRLVASVDTLTSGMLRGDQTAVEFTVTNTGGAIANNIKVLLPNAPWLKLASPATISSLGIGESAKISLLLTPDANLELVEYTGNLLLDADGNDGDLSLPFKFRAVSDAVASLRVNVENEFTYYAEGSPKLANATVILRDYFTSAEIRRTVTDQTGMVAWDDLPEGYYKLDVKAENHQSFSQNVKLDAGEIETITSFLSRQAVRYVWTVVPTEIEDEYKITLTSVFEADVPQPVITVEPEQIDMAYLRQIGNISQIDLTFTNHGLVASETPYMLVFPDTGKFPLTEFYEFKPLIDTIDRLEAKESLTIPVRITRVSDCTDGNCSIIDTPYPILGVPFFGTFFPLFEPAIEYLNIEVPNGGEGDWPEFKFPSLNLEGPDIPIVIRIPNSDATVKIQINQQALMTRSAFVGTLTIDNGNDFSLQNIKVNLQIENAQGNIVNDLFGITQPTLINLSAVDGTGILTPDDPNTPQDEGVGTAEWTFIPTNLAAPEVPLQYAIGGTLSYMEDGKTITVPLISPPVTVYPQAELYLDYFQSRNVYGDDPYTDMVEPSIPFSLAVLVRNEGKGDAKNLRITSSEPKIIENKSGLLIDFNIIGSQINGEDAEPSLTVNLGDIKAGETAVGDWLLKSSLQGKFIEYDATFEHVNSLGKPELSLIKEVKIHELIQKVQADGDDLPDFLVNDIVDPNVTPDTLYFSQGGTAPVKTATNVSADGVVSFSDRTVQVTATVENGWTYLNLLDPGQGFFNVKSITRADGTEVPLNNYWRTDRTFPASLEFEGTEIIWDVNNVDNPISVQEYDDKPIYEFRLHLLDYNATAGEQTYTVTYATGDQTAPKVRNMVYVDPVQPNSWLFPIPEELKEKDSIQLLFTEPIKRESFDLSDITVTLDGVPIDSSGLSITVQNPDIPIAFTIGNIEGISQKVGRYELSVNAAGVQDFEGNFGTGVVKEFWSVTGDRPFVESVSGFTSNLVTKPITQTITVKFSEAIEPGTFTWEDVFINRNEEGNLTKNTITVTQIDEKTYEVGNLTDITDVGGVYNFLVDAKGVVDLDGNRGVDAKGFTWTLDATPLSIVSLTGLSSYRRTKVSSLDVKFSKAIDASSFDFNDLIFTANGVTVQLDSSVTVTKLTDVSYRLSGLTGLQAGDGNYSLTVEGSGIQDDWGRAGTNARVVNWATDTVAPTKPTNLVFSLTDNVLSISGELEETGLRVYVVDRTDRQSLGELSVIGTSFSGDIQLPNGNDRTIAIQAFDGANNSATSLFKIVGGAIEPYNPPSLDLTSLNPYYSYSFVAQTGDFPDDGSSVDNTQSQISGFGTNDALEKTDSFNSSSSIISQGFSTRTIELQNTEPPVPAPVAIGFIKPEVSINDLGQIAFIGDGAAGGFTETWLGRTIKKDTILVANSGFGVKDIAPNMIKSTFANPNYGFLPDPSIVTFLLNTTARNPARMFDKFSDITISAGLSNREYAGGVQINNNGEVLVRRIELAEGPAMLMAYYLGNFIAPSFIASEYISKPYSFIEKWDANKTNTVTPVAQGFVPLLLLNDLSLALSGLTGMYGGLLFLGSVPILRTYSPDYYGLLSNPSFNNNGDTVFNSFLEGTWHPTASAGHYSALDTPSTTLGAPTIFTEQKYDPAAGAPRFWMADNGTVVRYYQNKIELLDDSLNVVKDIASDFSSLGKNPRISDDGTVVAFYGDLSEDGAEKYQTTPGEGIFVYRVEDGAIERIAGISGNGYLDQGEIWEDYNKNGTLDQGEDEGIFSGFDPDSPVGVNTQNIGHTVAYIGFNKQNNKGLYSTNFGFSNDENQLLLPSLIIEQGNGISDVAIYDPININGDIAFWVEMEDGRDAVMTAEAIPSIGIDRWWATVNDDPIVVNLYVSIPETGRYTLEIDTESLFPLKTNWGIKEDARVIIDGDVGKTVSLSHLGKADLGQLTQGRHQLQIDGFAVPSEPIVEEISFTLQKGNREIDKLVTKFVADHPEPDISQTLIAQYAPILLFEQDEKYNLPLDPDGYNWDEKLQRQEPNQDKPVRLGDAETIVNLNPDSLQSSPTIFATLLEQNGEIAISYYFHFAKSNWADFDGANTHDGDWEGITVFLKNGVPDRVAFNQHVEIAGFFGSTFTNEGDGGTTYRWEYLDFDEQTGRPKVYVGLGGHASYSKSGETTWFTPNPLDLFGNVESHSGNGEKKAPNVIYLPRVGDGYIGDAISTEDGKAQQWLLFPGKWGEQDKGEPFVNLDLIGITPGDDGIEGPVFQSLAAFPSKPGERWLNPWSFTDEFNIPLIAQDDDFTIRQQSIFVFDKEDFLANDNYDEKQDIWIIPNPVSALSGKIIINGDQFLYELPESIEVSAEIVIDSFDYLLLDFRLKSIYDHLTSTILNPSASRSDKENAFSSLHSLLKETPEFRAEEEDLIGTVEVRIERPKLSINNITVVEGLDNTAILTVTVDKPSPEQITVNYATAPVSATADLDYTSTTGTLIIPANTSTATITIPILNDDLDEENETFAIKLSNPVNAILTNNQGIVTIIDAKLSINNITVIEGQDSNAILTVTVNNPNPEQITVDYATAPVSATANVDYISKTGTLTIPANTSTATITIPILDDDINEENDETFAIKLSNPVNAILTNNQGIVTILTPKLSINNITVIEGQDSNAILSVSVDKPISKQISVDYTTVSSSATANVDYTSKTGTLTIPANTSTATITIPILNDDLNEENETFSIKLSNPVNATLDNNQGIVTIIDSVTDNIISIETTNNKYVNVVIPKNQPLTNIRAIVNPSPSNAPANVNFPVGFFDIDIPQISQGGATTVTLYLPEGSTANAYWKYGATPDNPTPHWYNFSYDPISKTGATFQDLNSDGQNEIILHFVDGQRGDDDLTANGQIVDPGAPAESINETPGNQAPTDLALSATTVNENVAPNTVIGTFSSTDPDTGNTFTYSLIAGTGDTDNREHLTYAISNYT
nr:Calx-beta domain-containing protein [Microcystis aeruginosa]